MKSGIIFLFFNKNDCVEFIIRDGENLCAIKGEVPDIALVDVSRGDYIWWQESKLYLRVFECDDVPFDKIGNTTLVIQHKHPFLKW